MFGGGGGGLSVYPSSGRVGLIGVISLDIKVFPSDPICDLFMLFSPVYCSFRTSEFPFK